MTQPDQPQPIDEPTLPPELGAFLAALDAAADQPYDPNRVPPGYVKGDDGITRTEAEHLAHTAGGPQDSPDALDAWVDQQLNRDLTQLTAAQQIRLAVAVAAIAAKGGYQVRTVAPIAAWVETGEA